MTNGEFKMKAAESDLEIFRELQRDGRTPFAEVAARLQVSESYVRKRVAHLRETDVFSITAVANPRLLGLENMCWIGLIVQHSQVTSISQFVVNLPDVDYVVQTAGRHNVMMEVACATAGTLLALLEEIRQIPGVHRTETFQYLDITYQGFQWSINADPPLANASMGRSIDSLDIDLIRCLQQDGRARFREIADQLAIAEREVSSRFNHLIGDGVMRIIAVGDPRSFGFEAMAWLGIHLAEGARLRSVATSLAEVPGIDYVVISSGRFDVMAELVCADHAELVRTLEMDVGKIEGINEIESFVYLQLLYKSTTGAWSVGRSPTIPD
jgi:DNA-binding Lrp family transcriptional regulator